MLLQGADTMIGQLYGSREFRRWALILYWIAMFVATHWPDINRYMPDTGWPFPHFDAVMHAIVYAGWVGMWWWFLSAGDRRMGRAAIGWILVGGVLWAVFDELTQALVARSPTLVDLVCDLIGMLLAIFILSLWQRPWLAARRPPT